MRRPPHFQLLIKNRLQRQEQFCGKAALDLATLALTNSLSGRKIINPIQRFSQAALNVARSLDSADQNHLFAAVDL